MKECKILKISANPKKLAHNLISAFSAYEHPDAEKFLKKYLDDGFTVKSLTENTDGSYTFYLEKGL